MSVCCLSLLQVLSDSLDKSANESISTVDEELGSSSFGPSLETTGCTSKLERNGALSRPQWERSH